MCDCPLIQGELLRHIYERDRRRLKPVVIDGTKYMLIIDPILKAKTLRRTLAEIAEERNLQDNAAEEVVGSEERC